MHDVGGNFGTRGGFNPEFAVVAWAARRVGRPVKWTGERREYFASDHREFGVEAAAGTEIAADIVHHDACLSAAPPARLPNRAAG